MSVPTIESVPHSPEPWVLSVGTGYDTVKDRDGARVLQTCRIRRGRGADWQDFTPLFKERKNGRRAVACVNALAGIPTEALNPNLYAAAPDLLDALIELEAWWSNWMPDDAWSQGGYAALEAARAAIARAGKAGGSASAQEGGNSR